MEAYSSIIPGTCTSNPGHVKFTPTASFSSINLPEGFCTLLVKALIYFKAMLTVKLKVNCVSRDRPVQFQGKDSDMIRGSGYVVDIDSRNPGCVTITIETAAHVVFNDAEAANTIVQFYFECHREVFQLRHAKLLAANPEKDVSRIMFTIDLETVHRLGNNLSNLENALSPSILPDINNGINNSLLHFVLVQYKKRSFSLLSFLFCKTACLKNIKFFSDLARKSKLEIEIQISHILLYDVILSIMAVASHHDRLIELLEDIGGRDVINMETVHTPFITVRKEVNYGSIANSTSKLPLSRFIEMDNQPISIVNRDFTIQQNVALFRLITCFSKFPIDIAELNIALRCFCQFDILSRMKSSDRIVFEIPVTSVNLLNRMSLEIIPNDVKVEEEHNHIAVLVSHPHEMPQQITVGKLEDSGTSRIVYKTPSCPGSSGAPAWVIPREPTSLEDLKNIGAFTHSHVNKGLAKGVGNRL